MRRLFIFSALIACAHRPPPADPLQWIDLQSEHFTLRTDLAAPQAQEVVGQHELAHVISNEALVHNPRWVAEGIACYLETMRFDRAAHRVFVGEPSRDRMAYLRRFPVTDFGPVFAMGSEAISLGPEAGFAYESAAWLLVHYLTSARAERFESFLSRLGRGEDPKKAFAAEFSDLAGAKLREEIQRYWEEGKGMSYAIAEPQVDGASALRSVSRAEVH